MILALYFWLRRFYHKKSIPLAYLRDEINADRFAITFCAPDLLRFLRTGPLKMFVEGDTNLDDAALPPDSKSGANRKTTDVELYRYELLEDELDRRLKGVKRNPAQILSRHDHRGRLIVATGHGFAEGALGVGFAVISVSQYQIDTNSLRLAIQLTSAYVAVSAFVYFLAKCELRSLINDFDRSSWQER